MKYPSSLQDLIDVFSRFPGIGSKTAQRLSFFLLAQPHEEVEQMARAMVFAKRKIRYCSLCAGFTEEDPCELCSNAGRDQSVICVVQNPRDVLVIEKTGQYRGYYHVLHGALSPVDGIGPEELRIPLLVKRIQEGTIREMVVATNPNVEGDATAVYLSRLIRPLGIKVTRIAFGLPVGGDLEYADELTLGRALEGRIEI